MFGPGLNPGPGCQRVVNGLLCNEPSLINLRARADRMFLQMGVTFNVYGETSGSERIFPFDPIPRVIDAATWSRLEAGLIQRIRALNAFLADIYTDGAIIEDGLIPRSLVVGCP